MRRTPGLRVGLLLGALLAVGAVGAGEPAPPMPLDRLLRANFAPLADPQQGRLYEAATRLLEAGRALPDAIDLGIKPAAAAGRPPGEQAVAEPPAAPSAEPEPAPRHEPWLALLEGPVVDEQELAYACFLAGSYVEAAGLYRDLRQRSPDDAHLLLMLLLSERNAGDALAVRGLMAELRKSGPEGAEWANWLTALTKLNAEVSKEVE